MDTIRVRPVFPGESSQRDKKNRPAEFVIQQGGFLLALFIFPPGDIILAFLAIVTGGGLVDLCVGASGCFERNVVLFVI